MFKGRAARAGGPVSALDPADLSQRRVVMPFRETCVRRPGVTFLTGRKSVFSNGHRQNSEDIRAESVTGCSLTRKAMSDLYVDTVYHRYHAKNPRCEDTQMWRPVRDLRPSVEVEPARGDTS